MTINFLFRSVLKALAHCLKNHEQQGTLSPDEANTLLKYFNDSCDQWRDHGESVAILRELPLHITGVYL